MMRDTAQCLGIRRAPSEQRGATQRPKGKGSTFRQFPLPSAASTRTGLHSIKEARPGSAPLNWDTPLNWGCIIMFPVPCPVQRRPQSDMATSWAPIGPNFRIAD